MENEKEVLKEWGDTGLRIIKSAHWSIAKILSKNGDKLKFFLLISRLIKLILGRLNMIIGTLASPMIYW